MLVIKISLVGERLIGQVRIRRHAKVGSSGVLEAQHAFARHFRDVHTITQHALCSPTRFESMGQVMLGMETDWAFFHI